MHAELTLSASTLIAFLLVLTRMTGAFLFTPMPGKGAGSSMPRILFSLACTFALFPQWPHVDASQATLGRMVMWLVSEIALGVAIGLMVSFIAEALTFGAQVLGLQAGYAYAAIVDPTTHDDSETLPVLAQLLAGLLFFAVGLDGQVIRAFAASLHAYPPGTFVINRAFAAMVLGLAANVFSVGVRLALPVAGLLLMVDIALALVGRIYSQLQMSMHAFPAKMLLTLFMIAAVLAAAPRLYEALASDVFGNISRYFAR
ncbi:MAG: flagellar biosynthetic protein FliR [Bryobacteraceae bacterium]